MLLLCKASKHFADVFVLHNLVSAKLLITESLDFFSCVASDFFLVCCSLNYQTFEFLALLVVFYLWAVCLRKKCCSKHSILLFCVSFSSALLALTHCLFMFWLLLCLFSLQSISQLWWSENLAAFLMFLCFQAICFLNVFSLLRAEKFQLCQAFLTEYIFEFIIFYS